MEELDEILDETDEHDYNIKKLMDINFESMINPSVLHNTLFDDAIYGVIMRILMDRTSKESLLYALPKSFQNDIYNQQYILKHDLLYYVPNGAYIIPAKLRYPITVSYTHLRAHET